MRQDKIGNTATCQELLVIGFDALNNRPSKTDNGHQAMAGTSYILAQTKIAGNLLMGDSLPLRGDDESAAVCGVHSEDFGCSGEELTYGTGQYWRQKFVPSRFLTGHFSF